MITIREFADGTRHFRACINFEQSYLDSEAIGFMNEIPNKVMICIQQHKDLLSACKAQHQAIDILFALLIKKDEKFLPTKSGEPWDAIQQGNKAIEEAETK